MLSQGKYESVFCASQGSPQERMEEFENAVRTVYALSLIHILPVSVFVLCGKGIDPETGGNRG